jgi:O-acetyl-ADP-ribose deacetylase (regulator of RNase III)
MISPRSGSTQFAEEGLIFNLASPRISTGVTGNAVSQLSLLPSLVAQ